MTRRELLLVAAGAMTVASGLRAEQKAMPVVGFLHAASPGPLVPHLEALRHSLGDAGYVEGQNVAIEYRWAEGRFDRLPELAADLVGRGVDVIVTSGGNFSALAAKNATSSIPIVFVGGGDPVKAGLVASLARPGGNLTGVNLFAFELWGKRVELISELVPGARALAQLVNPKFPDAERDTDGWMLVPLPRGANRDEAVPVDIVYAQKISSLKSAMPRALALAAPQTKTQTTYAEWELYIPQTHRLSSFGGNMTVARGTTYGLHDAWVACSVFYEELYRYFGPGLVFVSLALAGLCALIIAAIRRGWRGVLLVTGGVVGTAVLAMMFTWLVPS